MSKIRLFVTDNKELEIAEKFLSGNYSRSVEIFDKDPDRSSGITAEVLCHCKSIEAPDLLWICMELGEFIKYICWAKLED